jgi:hypothetical protein
MTQSAINALFANLRLSQVSQSAINAHCADAGKLQVS